VEKSSQSYTVGVKTSKSLHLLLAALLCYAQLVSSYHVAGHFYSHTDKYSATPPAFSDFSQHVHSHGPDNSDHTPHNFHRHHGPAFGFDGNSVQQANGSDSSENNCELYHALLNLSAVASADLHKATIISRSVAVVNCQSIAIGTLVLDTKRIRDPPVLS